MRYSGYWAPEANQRPRTLGTIAEAMTRINVACWAACDRAHAGQTDAEVAEAQREINRLNLERNRLIEEYDAALAHYRDRVPE